MAQERISPLTAANGFSASFRHNLTAGGLGHCTPGTSLAEPVIDDARMDSLDRNYLDLVDPGVPDLEVLVRSY